MKILIFSFLVEDGEELSEIESDAEFEKVSAAFEGLEAGL